LPFINFLPILKTETSPAVGLFAILVISAYFLRNKIEKINKYSIYMIIFVIFSMLFYRFDHFEDITYNFFYFKTFISLLFGMTVFLISIIYMKDRINHDLIKKMIFLWIAVGAIQLSPIQEFFNTFLKLILTRSASGGIEDTRGIQLLANEPSFAGIYLGLFLVLIDFFVLHRFVNKKQKWYLRVLIVTMIIATKSANALLLLLTYIILKITTLKNGIKIIFLFVFIIIPVFYLFIINNEFNARGFSVLKLLLTKPSLLLLDDSIASRFYFIYMSYYGFFDNFFLPNGVGSYSFNWMTIANQLQILDIYEINRSFGNYLMPMSFLGGISHDYGIFGLMLFLVIVFYPLFICKDKTIRRYILLSSFLVFLLWLQTCSYALPLPWFVLALNYLLIKKSQRIGSYEK
jgi:hypothetical protein